jgi:hypothetical protein
MMVMSELAAMVAVISPALPAMVAMVLVVMVMGKLATLTAMMSPALPAVVAMMLVAMMGELAAMAAVMSPALPAMVAMMLVAVMGELATVMSAGLPARPTMVRELPPVMPWYSARKAGRPRRRTAQGLEVGHDFLMKRFHPRAKLFQTQFAVLVRVHLLEERLQVGHPGMNASGLRRQRTLPGRQRRPASRHSRVMAHVAGKWTRERMLPGRRRRPTRCHSRVMVHVFRKCARHRRLGEVRPLFLECRQEVCAGDLAFAFLVGVPQQGFQHQRGIGRNLAVRDNAVVVGVELIEPRRCTIGRGRGFHPLRWIHLLRRIGLLGRIRHGEIGENDGRSRPQQLQYAVHRSTPYNEWYEWLGPARTRDTLRSLENELNRPNFPGFVSF